MKAAAFEFFKGCFLLLDNSIVKARKYLRKIGESPGLFGYNTINKTDKIALSWES